MSLTLGELAGQIRGDLQQGDPGCLIAAVATLQNAQAGDISFLANPGYKKYLQDTQASAVILKQEDAADCPTAVIVSANPYASYARAAALIVPAARTRQGVHPAAVLDAGSVVDETAWVGPNCIVEKGAVVHAGVQLAGGCFIGAGSVVGADSRLSANVVVCHDVTIGERVSIAPGAVIGSDGFGLANEDGRWLNVPQLGSVRVGNDVEIGSNTTIDRGALDDTVLEEGVRLDNQIQVAHNVHIGAHTAIAGCVGISGSAKIGKYCMIGGGSGIVGHLEIADRVIITGMTMVTKSITKPGVYSSGVPAQENDAWNKTYARMRQLDGLARRINKLERALAADKKHENE
ncbi:MAG: UDP-3-O-(3-hydroxymyristoyl)glucosamine N-acyltransferase [Gammaproteobacteria bacterium]|jgi:UDP-3-O-[3-hydroxymyristoyl] glucosamine N-acyltransferase|nr:UDP-3-O-(3-hydroxymyristoyl)glucosamine N-acyltransferase [Gammaproteobacteria bacterium]